MSSSNKNFQTEICTFCQKKEREKKTKEKAPETILLNLLGDCVSVQRPIIKTFTVIVLASISS